METRLHIDGMTCQNCVRHVQTALAGVPDVAAASVDLETKRARVTWNPLKEPGHLFELIEAVGAAGYQARPEKDASADGRDAVAEGTTWNGTLTLGLPITVVLMIAEWGFGLDHQPWYGWIALALTLPVMVWLGGPFYRNAWRQLNRNRLTMDTLVALGASAAFALSVYGLVRPGALGHFYFLEAAAILSLVGAGHWLEGRIARQANATLHALLHLAPETARRLPHSGDAADTRGEGESIPASALAEGDLIVLKPGDRLPVDGTLADGHGFLDESPLTGEADPVEKGPGAAVFAGTLNLSRRIVVRVVGRPGETALARVVATVERAQQSRAAIETLVDKVSNGFVIGVIGLGFLTFLGWGMLSDRGWEHAVVTAVAVLVVACPCAMGLATPAALLAASNAAAAKGVLFRDAAALEKCGKIDAVLFDKTGTLTLAVAAVEQVEPGPFPLAPDEFAALALALAAPSAHPWSRSVAAHFAPAARIAVQEWREERGAGVAAQYQGRPVRLGSPAWLIADGIAFPDAALPRLDRSLALAVGNELAGLVVLAKNRAKPEAARVVRELEREGLRVYVVSGDSAAAVKALAAEIGLPPDRLFAEIRPERKGEIVARLQAEGRKVAFVGDGINDAPALATADLGIAVVGATDAAREAADIVLLTRDLEAIPEIVGLSAATRRVVIQNLFWAFAYNAALLPLAVFGWIPPVGSALAMGLSDLCVMGNAARLLAWKRPPLPPLPSAPSPAA